MALIGGMASMKFLDYSILGMGDKVDQVMRMRFCIKKVVI
jgi:hypothetical protein